MSFKPLMKVPAAFFVAMALHHSTLEGVDLTPWMPKSSQMLVDLETKLKVVEGMKVHTHPVRTPELSLARDLSTDRLGNHYICGRGFIHRLVDNNGDGLFESTTPFTILDRDFHSIAWAGEHLYAATDNGLWRFTDADGNFLSDGVPDRIAAWSASAGAGASLSLAKRGSSELFVGGKWDSLPVNPAPNIGSAGPEVAAGGLILKHDLRKHTTELFARGFNNPMALSPNIFRDLISYDHGVQDGRSLPENVGGRILHVSPGSSHGYRREPGHWHESLGYFEDSIQTVLWTGNTRINDLAHYRHFHLPGQFFYGGLFGVDWASGRLLFYRLEPDGSSYSASPYLVAESTRNFGWAPRCIEVTPGGSLLVIHAETGSQGMIYEFSSAGQAATPPITREMDAVIRTPQPFAEWSIPSWIPLAEAIESDMFIECLIRDTPTAMEKLAALDALMETGTALSADMVDELSTLTSPEFMAYYFRYSPNLDAADMPEWSLLWAGKVLKQSSTPFATRLILEKLTGIPPEKLAGSQLPDHIWKLCESKDHRIRKIARACFFRLPHSRVERFFKQYPNLPSTRKVDLLAYDFSNEKGPVREWCTNGALQEIIDSTIDPHAILECLALAYQLNPLSEEHFHLRSPAPDGWAATLRDTVSDKARRLYPTSSTPLNNELARFLALTGSMDETLASRIASGIITRASAPRNIHYLRALIRSGLPLPPRLHKRVAETTVELARSAVTRFSLEDHALSDSLNTLLTQAVDQWEWFPETLGSLPDFPSERDGLILQLLEAEQIDFFLSQLLDPGDKGPAAAKVPEIKWSIPLVRALAKSNRPDSIRIMIQLWSIHNLRLPVMEFLAESPVPEMLPAVIESLDHPSPAIRNHALDALLKASPAPALNLQQTGALVRNLMAHQGESPTREKINTVIGLVSSEPPGLTGARDFEGNSFKDLGLFLHQQFQQRYPEDIRFLEVDPQDNPAEWAPVLESIDWSAGNPSLGKLVFNQRRCAQCHGPSYFFGPDLAETTSVRMAPRKLAEEILFPHRNITDGYRTWLVQGKGFQFMGFLVSRNSESALFTAGADTAARIRFDDINIAAPAHFSIMPGGLLAGLEGQQIADLIAYLQLLD